MGLVLERTRDDQMVVQPVAMMICESDKPPEVRKLAFMQGKCLDPVFRVRGPETWTENTVEKRGNHGRLD
jgi:hypothetical protein